MSDHYLGIQKSSILAAPSHRVESEARFWSLSEPHNEDLIAYMPVPENQTSEARQTRCHDGMDVLVPVYVADLTRHVVMWRLAAAA